MGQLLYRGLLRLDGHASPARDLADAWGVSGDGLTYRFTLRQGLRWSDGSALTARDVQATVAMVQSAGFADSTLAAAWHGVTVSVAGTSTVTLGLTLPRASLAVAVAELPVLPAAELGHLSPATLAKSSATAMPTSGPFRIASADAAHVRLESNRFASPQPLLHGVDLRLVKSFDAATQTLALGQVDGVVATTPTQRAVLHRLGGIRLHDITTFRFVDIVLNQRRPGLDDPAVRHAIETVVDRQQLIAAAVGGDARPQVGAIPVGIAWIAAPQADLPSAALAGRALDAAGWTVGTESVRHKGDHALTFALSVPDAAPLPAVATQLARQLRSAGIAVTTRVVKPDAFESSVLMSENFDMVVADWDNGADPDVSSFWRSNATPPHGFNLSGGQADPFLDRALDSLATVNDSRLRRAAAGQVDDRLAEDTPAIFLYAPEVTFAVSDQLASVVVPTVGASGSRFDGVAAWHRESG